MHELVMHGLVAQKNDIRILEMPVFCAVIKMIVSSALVFGSSFGNAYDHGHSMQIKPLLHDRNYASESFRSWLWPG